MSKYKKRTQKVCWSCDRRDIPLDVSHLLKDSGLVKYPKFDREKHFVLQCRACHREYELLNAEGRLEYWRVKHYPTYEILKEIME